MQRICRSSRRARHPPVVVKINPCPVLRDVIPPIPRGPEGCNGNGLVRAMGTRRFGYFLPVLTGMPAAVRTPLASAANWPVGSRSRYFW